MLTQTEYEIVDEIWEGCYEQLSMIDPILWDYALVPVFVRMIAKERDMKEYYKKRLDVEQSRTGNK